MEEHPQSLKQKFRTLDKKLQQKASRLKLPNGYEIGRDLYAGCVAITFLTALFGTLLGIPGYVLSRPKVVAYYQQRAIEAEENAVRENEHWRTYDAVLNDVLTCAEQFDHNPGFSFEDQLGLAQRLGLLNTKELFEQHWRNYFTLRPSTSYRNKHDVIGNKLFFSRSAFSGLDLIPLEDLERIVADCTQERNHGLVE